jgi:hypothetical protein
MTPHPRLIGWWRMEDSATDASGNALNGTFSGTTSSQTGKFGRARRFVKASSGSCTVAHDALLNVQQMTLCAWMRRPSGSAAPEGNDTVIGRPVSTSPTDVPYRFFYARQTAPDPLRLFAGYFADGVAVQVQDSGTGVFDVDGTWFHYAMTISFSSPNWTIRLYRDAVLIASASSTSAPPIRTSSLFFGSEDARRYADIDLDEIMLWDAPLSIEDIRLVRTMQLPQRIGA